MSALYCDFILANMIAVSSSRSSFKIIHFVRAYSYRTSLRLGSPPTGEDNLLFFVMNVYCKESVIVVFVGVPLNV